MKNTNELTLPTMPTIELVNVDPIFRAVAEVHEFANCASNLLEDPTVAICSGTVDDLETMYNHLNGVYTLAGIESETLQDMLTYIIFVQCDLARACAKQAQDEIANQEQQLEMAE